VTGVAYVGSKGTHIDTTRSNFNNPDPALGNIQNRRPIQSWADSLDPDKANKRTQRVADGSVDRVHLRQPLHEAARGAFADRRGTVGRGREAG
jgi:hypothetical protein